MNKKGKNFQTKKFKTKGCPSKAEEEEWEGACLEKFGRKKLP